MLGGGLECRERERDAGKGESALGGVEPSGRMGLSGLRAEKLDSLTVRRFRRGRGTEPERQAVFAMGIEGFLLLTALSCWLFSSERRFCQSCVA